MALKLLDKLEHHFNLNLESTLDQILLGTVRGIFWKIVISSIVF